MFNLSATTWNSNISNPVPFSYSLLSEVPSQVTLENQLTSLRKNLTSNLFKKETALTQIHCLQQRLSFYQSTPSLEKKIDRLTEQLNTAKKTKELSTLYLLLAEQEYGIPLNNPATLNSLALIKTLNKSTCKTFDGA